MADADRSGPPSHFTGRRMVPRVLARLPHPRHGLTTFRANHRVKEQNSLLEPWVDVQADIDAINAGEGVHEPGTMRTWVNGRLYGMHGQTGTTWPEEGEGIIPVNRSTYRALLILRRYNGISELSELELSLNLGLSDTDREEARRIWRLREQAKRHAPDDGLRHPDPGHPEPGAIA